MAITIEERNRIILENVKIVPWIVKHFFRRYYNNYSDYEELCSIANLHMIQAAMSFNPERGVKAATYLTVCIRRRLWDVLRHIRTRKNGRSNLSLSKIDNLDGINYLTHKSTSDHEEMADFLAECSRKLPRVIRHLNTRQRTVVEMTLAGKKRKEIAAVLDCTITTVANVLDTITTLATEMYPNDS